MERASVSELFGLAGAIVILAGVSVAIIYGSRTAAVVNAMGSNFAGSIRAATLQPGGGRTIAR